MSVFDTERMTAHQDWKDSVDARISWMTKEIEALKIEVRHASEVIKNIKVDCERAIENR